MCAYISVADAAECMRRQGQGAKGSRCGSGWVRASSGRTGLRVDATGGAQDGVGCHSHDINLVGDYLKMLFSCFGFLIKVITTNQEYPTPVLCKQLVKI